MPSPSWLARLFVRSGAVRLFPGLQRRLDGGADFLHYYSDRLLNSPLSQLERVASALEDVPPDVIDLTVGSPRFDLLPSSSTRLPADRRGWPPPGGLPELRGAIAAKLLAENRLSVSPAEEVLVTSGALGAASIIFDAFVNRGDSVVLTDPISPMYPLLAQTRGASVRWVQARCDEGRLKLRLDHLASRLRGARLLVVNSPHNPTGGMIAPEDLEQIAWWCHRHDVLILSDECLDRYTYGEPYTSLATLARARHRTLTVNSVSKSHALAWSRVGWIAGYRHLLRPCFATAALRSPFVPILSQQIALTALRVSSDAFEEIDEQLIARRQFAFERLLGMGFDPQWPASGFFFWLPVSKVGQSARSFSDSLLRDRRVKVVPGDLFGPSGSGYVRISFAIEDGRLEEGLNRLAEQVESHKESRLRAA